MIDDKKHREAIEKESLDGQGGSGIYADMRRSNTNDEHGVPLEVLAEKKIGLIEEEDLNDRTINQD